MGLLGEISNLHVIKYRPFSQRHHCDVSQPVMQHLCGFSHFSRIRSRKTTWIQNLIRIRVLDQAYFLKIYILKIKTDYIK